MSTQDLESRVGILEKQEQRNEDDVRDLRGDLNQFGKDFSNHIIRNVQTESKVDELEKRLNNEVKHELGKKLEKRTLKDNVEVALIAVVASGCVTLLFHALGL